MSNETTLKALYKFKFVYDSLTFLPLIASKGKKNVICKTCAVKTVLLVIVTVDLHSSFTFLLSKVQWRF